jgi:molecular chaperone GrpE
VLADFRVWLTGLGAPPEGAAPPAPVKAAEGPDLFTLLSQFVALRHEVNLQTRAVRAQQEQNAETLRQLAEALDALRGAGASADGAREEQRRPLLQTLVELHDALALAAREAERVRNEVLPALDKFAAEDDPGPTPNLPDVPPRPSAWARLLGGAGAARELETLRSRWEAWRKQEEAGARSRREAAGRVRRLLASLVTGYTMSLQRLERALRQHGLDPIPAAGQPFDPERMEAVEAVEGSGRPPGAVLDEVRRGYLWNGRVFRFAQVRVAKS